MPEAGHRNGDGPERTGPAPKTWSPHALANEPVVIDHPLWRRAPAVAGGIGAAAGLAVFLFADTVWWMPILVFLVVASVLFRLLRPRLRHPSIEDEI